MAQLTMDRPQRILFLDHAKAIGGAERVLLELLRRMDRTRWDLHLAGRDGPLLGAAANLEVQVHPISMPRIRNWGKGLSLLSSGARRIRNLARQIEATYIHANTVRTAFYGSLASITAGIPWVWQMHDLSLSENSPPLRFPENTAKALLCLSAARVVAISHSVAEQIPCSSKIAVVHNGIDVRSFKPGPANLAFRKVYGVPPEVRIVGTIGRLRPWKGQDRFLRSMKRVADWEPSAWFLVVGGAAFDVQDDYPDRLKRLADELGIADRVIFTGHLNDVRQALSTLDVFVHAGDPEPFGLVVLEAMAMTKPVVAFGHGALPEIVVDGKTGILVRPTDEEALSNAVLQLLQDASMRTRIGTAARARVEKQFTAEQMVAAVSSVYRDLANEG